MHENSLSPELKRRLAEMQHVKALPEDLEERVVERLRREGAFGRPRSFVWLAIASAAAVLFIAGFFAGRIAAKPSTPEFTYVLLLQEGGSYQRAARDADTKRRIDEYREWASTLRSHGIDISGLKLQDGAAELGAANPAAFAQLAGFFMVRARNMEEARHIAESCPHLRYGGGVVIRPIEKT
jgi:hypothetical protein